MKEENEEIIEKILERCNFREKIVVKLGKKILIKAYKLGITFGFNNK